MKPFTLSELARKLDALGHNGVADNLNAVADVAEAVLEAAGLDWTLREREGVLEEYAPQTPEHRAAGWETIGICGVDAGALMVGDPCYFFGPDCEAQKKGAWRDVLQEAYAAGLSPKEHYLGSAQLAYVRGQPGLAVLLDVDGDGTYSIEARRNARGQIVEVRFFTGAQDAAPANGGSSNGGAR